MNSQGFLGLFAIVGVFFLFWYVRGWGGASKGPTRLDLRAPDTEPVVIPPESVAKTSEVSSKTAPDVGNMRDVTPDAPPKRVLQVMFNYNGHSWDAHEVLGVKPGSSMKEITAAYQTALQRTQPETHAFLEIAYKSILSRF